MDEPDPPEQPPAPRVERERIDTGVTEAIRKDPELFRLWLRDEHQRVAIEDASEAAHEPAERMSVLETTLRRRWRWLAVSLIPVLSGLLTLGHYLVERTAADARSTIEREQLLVHDADYERRIRIVEDLARRNTQRLDDLYRGGRTDWDTAPLDHHTAPRTSP